MAELDLDRVNDAQEQAAVFIRATEARKLSTRMSPALLEAVRGLEKLDLGNRTALTEAAKAFEKMRPMIGSEIAEAMNVYGSRLNVPGALALALQNSSIVNAQSVSARLGEALKSPFAEALKNVQLVSPLIPDMSEAVRRATVAPGLRFAPVEVVRRAAEIAEDHAAGEVAADVVASLDLEHASPKERSALEANVVGAIGALATVVAVLMHTRRLDLAVPLIGLIAYLIAIRGQIRGK